MGIPTEKKRLFTALFLLSAVFLLVRIRTIGHLLMWDEAWNILSLRAFLAGAAKDPFYWYYGFHPPLYMFFAKFLAPFAEGFALRAESLSLLFSYGSFLAVFFLSRRIGGLKYAVLTGIFLCFMPSSIGYDTWIKRDALAVFTGYLSLLLILDRRFLLSAMVLGLSFLSKESALFFCLPAAFLIFTVSGGRKMRIFFMFALVVLAISAWWYLFFSNLFGDVSAFYFSGEYYGKIWSRPAWYYLEKLVTDLGAGGVFFFLPGILILPYFSYIKRKAEIALPVVVILCVYIPISLLARTKTPWLSYSALPALAMTAGGGALFLFGRSHFSRLLRTILYLMLGLVVFTGSTFSYRQYHKSTYPNGWPGASSSRDLALYLNRHMDSNDRLMITDFAYWKMPICPIFVYYWRQHPVMFIKGTESPSEILRTIKEHRISWFVVCDSPDKAYNHKALVEKMRLLLPGGPVRVGWSYVWDLSSYGGGSPAIAGKGIKEEN
ncbi:MAG: hypothetical protein GF409_06110 [Candidatus Omnitrophica bacterium]|nr:hypothetical protein [Candidatus Omnitrophota bacterium]